MLFEFSGACLEECVAETFHAMLRRARRNALDPQYGGQLSQERFAELLGQEPGVAGTTGATVSNWERGKFQPRSADRSTLRAIVVVLLRCGGLGGLGEANALLTHGGYAPFSQRELLDEPALLSEIDSTSDGQPSHVAGTGIQAVMSTGVDAPIVERTSPQADEDSPRDTGSAARSQRLDSAPTLIAIRHQSMEQIPARAVWAALPAKLQVCEIIKIVVDQCDLFQNSRLIDPYEAAQRQRDLEERVAALLARYPEAYLAYYGIAHIPLLFLAGYTLSNRRAIMLFENDRYARTWDLLQRGGSAPALHLSGLPSTVDRGCGDIVVRISISYRVTEEVVAEVISEPLASLELGLEQPQLDAITSERQLREYTQAFRQLMDQIHHCFPNATGIHIFYAGPPSLAFCCGQLVSKTIHPRLIVYNFFGKDRPKYSWGLDLTGNLDRDDMLLRPEPRVH